jgi:hypothetical protein
MDLHRPFGRYGKVKILDPTGTETPETIEYFVGFDALTMLIIMSRDL